MQLCFSEFHELEVFVDLVGIHYLRRPLQFPSHWRKSPYTIKVL